MTDRDDLTLRLRTTRHPFTLGRVGRLGNLMTDPYTEEGARILSTAGYFTSVEGPEEGIPLFGSASESIRTNYTWDQCFGNLEDVENLLSSGPAPAGHAVDTMQWQDSATPPARHPENVIIAKSPLRTFEYLATAEGKLDATNLMEKGKSVMFDEGDVAYNRDALKTMKSLTMEQLAERFRKEILVKLVAHNRHNSTTKAMETKKQIADTDLVPHGGISAVITGRVDQKKDEVVVTGEEGAPGIDSEEQQIVVPNPDFHDFDADRTEAHVKKKQIWALYDGTDGMPRFYCQINKVVRYPFYVEGIWLEPLHPEKECFTWLKQRELSIGTGEFKLGEEVAFDTINTFSHLMGSTKLYTHPRNPKLYEVHPTWPEVWAIYTDYGKDTSTDAEGKPKLRFEFVFMRSEFSRSTGEGRVAKLQKLKGYNTLWTPHAESFQITAKDNLRMFSHRVPAVQVRDVRGVPCECLELDPASTSTDVVQT